MATRPGRAGGAGAGLEDGNPDGLDRRPAHRSCGGRPSAGRWPPTHRWSPVPSSGRPTARSGHARRRRAAGSGLPDARRGRRARGPGRACATGRASRPVLRRPSPSAPLPAVATAPSSRSRIRAATRVRPARLRAEGRGELKEQRWDVDVGLCSPTSSAAPEPGPRRLACSDYVADRPGSRRDLDNGPDNGRRLRRRRCGERRPRAASGFPDAEAARSTPCGGSLENTPDARGRPRPPTSRRPSSEPVTGSPGPSTTRRWRDGLSVATDVLDDRARHRGGVRGSA